MPHLHLGKLQTDAHSFSPVMQELFKENPSPRTGAAWTRDSNRAAPNCQTSGYSGPALPPGPRGRATGLICHRHHSELSRCFVGQWAEEGLAPRHRLPAQGSPQMQPSISQRPLQQLDPPEQSMRMAHCRGSDTGWPLHPADRTVLERPHPQHP